MLAFLVDENFHGRPLLPYPRIFTVAARRQICHHVGERRDDAP
jgi:hypothetical protein